MGEELLNRRTEGPKSGEAKRNEVKAMNMNPSIMPRFKSNKFLFIKFKSIYTLSSEGLYDCIETNTQLRLMYKRDVKI